MKMKHLTAVALAFSLPLVAAVAQDDGPQGPPPDGANQGPPDGGPGRGMRRTPPQIIAALDASHDGVIDASEIANAPAALNALLAKSGKTQLTIMDLMGPPRGRGGMGPGGGQGQGFGPGPGGPGGDQGPGAGPNGGPPGPPPDGTNGVAGRRGPGRGMHRVPPIFAALDTNHDGVIDASEIANASAALKTLDKDGTGQLSVRELLGPPPGRGPGGPGFGPGPGSEAGQGPGPDGPQPGGPDGGPDGGQMPPPQDQ
jgi:EF hand